MKHCPADSGDPQYADPRKCATRCASRAHRSQRTICQDARVAREMEADYGKPRR
jgi:hypothetical protein